MNAKHVEFRYYLENTGIVDALSKALVKLFDMPAKPINPLEFIRMDILAQLPPDEPIDVTLQIAQQRVSELEAEIAKLKVKERPSDSAFSDPSEFMVTALKELHINENCQSLLKTCLTTEIIDELEDVKTESYQSTLFDCVQSGLQVPYEHIGVFATDSDCYLTFAKIFDSVLSEIYSNYSKDCIQPAVDWGNADNLPNSDPSKKYLGYSQISTYRALDGFPFHGKMTEDEYVKIMEKIQQVLNRFSTTELRKGQFYPYESLDVETAKKLGKENLLFKQCSRVAQIAGASKFWPIGRAIYVNQDRSFLVWINHEEHLRFTSIQRDGDLVKMYKRLVIAAQSFDKHLRFKRHTRLGWATFSPFNVGNALEILVTLKLVRIPYCEAKMKEIFQKFNLELKSTKVEGEKTIYEILNGRDLGCTEFQVVKRVYDGIAEICNLENELEDKV